MEDKDKNRLKEQQINIAYDAWQHLLRAKLEQLEFFLESVKADLSSIGMSRVDSTVFLNKKIEEIRAELSARDLPKTKRRAV